MVRRYIVQVEGRFLTNFERGAPSCTLWICAVSLGYHVEFMLCLYAVPIGSMVLVYMLT